MARTNRRYTAKLKFRVAMEAVRGERSPAQIGKAYGVHANTVGQWRQQLMDRGVSIFERGSGGSADSEKRIADLERLLGKKEVEIALLKNFLGQTQ